jgi:hypothetical protein
MLAEVTSAIAATGVNIIALSAHGAGKDARFLIVTDDNQKAMSALKAKKFNVMEGDAVSVSLSNKVGSAKELAERLAKAGVDLNYCYGSTGNGSEALLVFATKDIQKALEACG